MNKPVILTGLRANNNLHIGNYLGALLPLISMAKKKSDDYQINLFVPDLHSFTTPIDHAELYAQCLANIKVYVAAGLPINHESVHVYRQSYIPAHSELTWILDCFTGYGEMGRMTQFKDKSLKLHADRISVGLFNYPVLMASDMLLYDASYVPVGEDQAQHLEFTRDIARRMNNQFGELFTVPKSVTEQYAFFSSQDSAIKTENAGLRIRDLTDPSKKMSKSDESGKGVLFLSDTLEAAHKKILSATTDSIGVINYDLTKQPGISNLLNILSLLSGRDIDAVVAEFAGQTQYGPLKTATAEVVCNFLAEFQSRLESVNDTEVMAKLATSEQAMNTQASRTLLNVQRAVGLRP